MRHSRYAASSPLPPYLLLLLLLKTLTHILPPGGQRKFSREPIALPPLAMHEHGESELTKTIRDLVEKNTERERENQGRKPFQSSSIDLPPLLDHILFPPPPPVDPPQPCSKQAKRAPQLGLSASVPAATLPKLVFLSADNQSLLNACLLIGLAQRGFFFSCFSDRGPTRARPGSLSVRQAHPHRKSKPWQNARNPAAAAPHHVQTCRCELFWIRIV